MDEVGAIVAAGGSGLRLRTESGDVMPKALRTLGDKPLVAHAVAHLQAAGIETIVVVGPHGWVRQLQKLLGASVTVVVGGKTRQDSVYAGIAALPADTDIVLVHDAARALAPPELIQRVVEAVRSGHDAVVPGLAVIDTIKVVDELETVIETPDRSSLRTIQTPQGFRRALLEQAHVHARTDARFGNDATDDAGLVEELGKPVLVVEGDRRALKVTTPEDLVLATALLELQ
jgi:2-C-methyl-D-erythritol 4-phosphate cytidylyltransferase